MFIKQFFLFCIKIIKSNQINFEMEWRKADTLEGYVSRQLKEQMEVQENGLDNLNCSSNCSSWFNIIMENENQRGLINFFNLQNHSLMSQDNSSDLLMLGKQQSYPNYSQNSQLQRQSAQDSSILNSVLISNKDIKSGFIDQGLEKGNKKPINIAKGLSKRDRKLTSYQESPQKQKKRRTQDPDFDESKWPKKKPKTIKKNQKRVDEFTPHNAYSQVCEKLKKCLDSQKAFKNAMQNQFQKQLKYNKKSLQLIINQQSLIEPLKYIFENDKWLEKIKQGQAKQPQMKQNIRVAKMYQNQFFNHYYCDGKEGSRFALSDS